MAPAHAHQPGRLVVTGHGACFWTDAQGRWKPAQLPTEASQGIAHLWASDAGALFATDVLGHLLTSTDLGERWSLVGQTPCSWLKNAAGDRSGKRVCVHGQAGKKLGNSGCWLSSDGGKRWRRLAFKGSDAVTSLAFGADGSLWVSVAQHLRMNDDWTEVLRGRG